MKGGDHTFAASLVVSLALHAAIATALIRNAPPPAAAVVVTPRAFKPATVYIDDRTDASEHFGLPDGAGTAGNARPGEEPLIAREGDQMQAFLSRDPVGPGSVGDDPSMSVLPKSMSPSGSSDAAAMIGAAPRAVQLIAPSGGDETPLLRLKNSPLAMAQTPGDGARQTSQAPPADPAIMSDSESDPFAPGMQVDFRDGGVEARFGRKVKTIRPRLTLAARIDLMTTDDPRMTVRLHVAADGAVRLVEIIRSSGSAAADQAVKVALYQWWVEPKQDPWGRLVASVITFPIVWR